MDEKIVRIAIYGMTENKGGIESVVMNIYRNIDRKKVQFDFLLPHNSGEMAYEQEVLDLGGRIFRIVYAQRESYAKAKKCWLDFFHEHPEVKGIHVHTNFPYVFPVKMARKAGVKIRIVHAHNSVLLFENDTRSLKGKFYNIKNKIVYKQIKNNASELFSCSDLAAKSTFNSNEYVWIKNSIDLKRFQYNHDKRTRVRKEYGISNDDKVIGFVGVLCERKNPKFALEVFKQYNMLNPKSKMVYVGGGNLDEVKELAKEHGLEEKVIFTGMVSDSYKWFQVFDFLLLPSLYEGFPVVLVEAQASGLQSLVSDRVTEQVKVTDLIEYMPLTKSPETWAKKMEELINNSKEREAYWLKMQELGFDIKSMANEVEQFYLE